MMTKLFKLLALATLLLATLTASAGQYQIQSFIAGESTPSSGLAAPYEGAGMLLQGDGYTNSLTLYAASAYMTNVVVTNAYFSPPRFSTNTAQSNYFYTNMIATNGFYPKATNYSGAIMPSWSAPVNLWSDSHGNCSTNLSLLLSITWGGSANFTNTAVLTFVRSVDGVNFDTNTTWSITKSNLVAQDTLTTNFTDYFLRGAKQIKLNSVALGSNSGVATFTIQRCVLGGFAQ